MNPERPAASPPESSVEGHVEPGHGDQRTYSPRAVRSDGTYAGQGAGYGGTAHSEGAAADAAAPGEGTYGYPHGPGVGDTGGRRPDDEAADLSAAPALVPEDADPNPGPGDRFGAGRQHWWQGEQDPGNRDAELELFRSQFADGSQEDYREWLRERARAREDGLAGRDDLQCPKDAKP